MAEELQYLIERIQKEAVDSAEQQAAQLIAQSKDRAAAIVKEAEEKAAAILRKAEQDAQVFTERSMRTLDQAARDLLITVGQGVENIIADIVAEAAGEALKPQVLEQMDSKLDWTQQLGDAFLAQQKDVMATVQSLRAKAVAAGNLKSTEQQVVKSDAQGGQTTYIIESPKPDVVYVPTYNPTVVYGSWWYPVPPYTVYPPAYVYPPGLAFATGVFVGAAIWGSCNWWHGDVDVNVNRYNNFNRTNIENKTWQHNGDHRRGVAYSDNSVAQKYNRSGSADAVKARENYRGRAESGRGELQTMDRQSLNDQVRQADRASNDMRGSGERGGASRGEIDRGFSQDAANRQRSEGVGSGSRGEFDRGSSPDAGNRQRGGGDRSASVSDRAGGSFSGVGGGGGATREASQRGMSSRGGGAPSGARAGGGGGRGGRR